MTGFVGGTVTGGTLTAMRDEMWTEPWYHDERLEAGSYGLAVTHHGTKDPDATTVWGDGRAGGVIHGVCTNRDRLGLDTGELFERILDRPRELLTKLDGPFAIACFDAIRDRVVLATDRLGTRRCQYVLDDGIVLGTDVRTLLETVDNPQVDERGICDLLTIGQVWGNRTLVESVRSLPPAHVLVYEAGDVTIDRYWQYDYNPQPRTDYADDLVSEYERVVADIAETVSGNIGLWLSGGLDSRSMAAALRRAGRHPVTYTYDANPVGAGNLDLAASVAETLGLPNETVDIDAEQFMSVFDDSIRITDGLIPWVSLTNLAAVWSLPDRADVMLEASGQAVLMGSGIWKQDVELATSAAEALYRAEHMVDQELVRALLSTDIDPMRTYREAVDADHADGVLTGALDGLHRNYFRGGDFTSNKLARTQVGTRVAFSDDAFLDLLMELPYAYREAAVPLTDGVVPFGCAPMKLELVRRLDGGLEQIPYERTRLLPSRPLWQHAIGFAASAAVGRLRSDITYGSRSMPGEWYRQHTPLRRRVDALLDSAGDRPWFDAAELDRLRTEHLERDGEHIQPIACVTTAEWLIQEYVD